MELLDVTSRMYEIILGCLNAKTNLQSPNACMTVTTTITTMMMMMMMMMMPDWRIKS